MKSRCKTLSLLFSAVMVALIAVPVVKGAPGAVTNTAGEKCMECHAKTTPNVVNDWKLEQALELAHGLGLPGSQAADAGGQRVDCGSRHDPASSRSIGSGWKADEAPRCR